MNKNINKTKSSAFVFLQSMVILIFLSACKSKTATPALETLTVSGIGSVNFGRVPLNEVRTAGIKIDNQTSQSKNIAIPLVTSPFSVYLPSTTCSAILPPMSSCLIAIRFNPLIRDVFTQKITVLGTTVDFTGSGTDSGILTVFPLTWNVGSVLVGSIHTQRFNLENTGDLRINAPVILNVNDFQISGTNCLTQILPGVSCYVDITFQRNVAETSVDLMRLSSDMSVFADIEVTSTTIPGNGDGLILFSGVPSTVVSDGNDIRTIQIVKVPDLYGNSVSNGKTCSLTASNLTFPDGSVVTINNGTASFRIQSTTLRGASTVSVVCDQAYGSFGVKSASDKAVGVINVLPFNNNLRADGLTSVTIKTTVVKDQYLNAINDGELIYYELVGGGSLDTSSGPSLKGQGQVRITSGTLIGSSILKIRSNPIYTDGVITGWGAQSGDIAINFTSGYPSGIFPVATSIPSIYSKPGSGLGLIDEALITVGAILDGNGNLAGAGIRADVRVFGGVNKASGLDQFSIYTGGDSKAYFNLVGNGTRGFITIEIDISNTTQTIQVFASDDGSNFFLPYLDRMRIYKTYGPSQFTLLTDSLYFPASSRWQRYDSDLASIEAKDTSHLGTISYSGPPFELSYNFPRLIGNDCLQNVGAQTQILPCFYYTKLSQTYWGSSGVYNIGYNGTLDILRLTSLDKQLGASDAHGSYSTIFPMQTYHQKSDSFVTSGGIQYKNLSAPYEIDTSPSISTIRYPSSLFSQFDLMNYFKESSPSDSIAYQSSYSEINGNSYFYGGLDSDWKTLNLMYKIVRDPEAETGVAIEELAIDPDPSFGVPTGTILSALYENEVTKEIYVVGGLKKPTTTWSFNDEVWKIDLKTTPLVWYRVCVACGLPVPNTTSLINALVFPLSTNNTPTQFENLTDFSRKMEITRDLTGKTYLFTEGEGVREINLLTGATTTVTDPNIIAMSSGNMVKINPLSGRSFSFRRGQKNSSDSKLWFYETPIATKQFYMTEYSLDSNSKAGVQKINFVISGFAYGKDKDGSEVYGMSAYAFNHETLRWSLLGQTTSESESETSSGTITVTRDQSSFVSQFVSTANKVNLLLIPTASPGCLSGACVNNGESDLKINYIEINGVW